MLENGKPDNHADSIGQSKPHGQAQCQWSGKILLQQSDEGRMNICEK